MNAVLFLDFDGVLHRGNSYLTPKGIVSSAPGSIVLFEFAPVLDELLRPYPHLQLVLSTDWCARLGFERARAALPLESLRARVVDATFDVAQEGAAMWLARERGAQIQTYVRQHGLSSWLAIDDRIDGFQGCYDRLIHCQTETGLGDSDAVDLLRIRLQERFG